MGSVRRMAESRHDCDVVLVGDAKVGKTALVNRFVHDKFLESYKSTSFEKFSCGGVVSHRRMRYTIWDTSGSHSLNSSRTLAYRNADVFLLCYKISDPNTLFSALNHWFPELRSVAPSTPIVLVGCQSDLRTDRDVLSNLARQGRAPVSSDQATTFSQQISALAYVETSSKVSSSSKLAAAFAFEVAGLVALGKIQDRSSTPSPKTSTSFSFKKRRDEQRDSLERDGHTFWDRFSSTSSSPKLSRSLGSSSRSASLSSSKTRISTASIPSSSLSSTSSASSSTSTSSSSNLMCGITTTGSKTPKTSRKSNNRPEKMITLKCQRMTADKTFEEVEIEVPAPIYETIQLYNDAGSLAARNKERRSLGAKIKNLFTKN